MYKFFFDKKMNKVITVLKEIKGQETLYDAKWVLQDEIIFSEGCYALD